MRSLSAVPRVICDEYGGDGRTERHFDALREFGGADPCGAFNGSFRVTLEAAAGAPVVLDDEFVEEMPGYRSLGCDASVVVDVDVVNADEWLVVARDGEALEASPSLLKSNPTLPTVCSAPRLLRESSSSEAAPPRHDVVVVVLMAPLWLEPFHHFVCPQCDASDVFAKLRGVLTARNVDVVAKTEKAKLKCWASGAREVSAVVFVMRLWRGDDGELIVEGQRRSGCSMVWNRLYSVLVADLVEEGVAPLSELRPRMGDVSYSAPAAACTLQPVSDVSGVSSVPQEVTPLVSLLCSWSALACETLRDVLGLVALSASSAANVPALVSGGAVGALVDVVAGVSEAEVRQRALHALADMVGVGAVGQSDVSLVVSRVVPVAVSILKGDSGSAGADAGVSLLESQREALHVVAAVAAVATSPVLCTLAAAVPVELLRVVQKSSDGRLRARAALVLQCLGDRDAS